MTYSSTSFYARATDPFLSLSAVCLNTGEETEGWSSTSSVSPSYGGWVTPNDPSWVTLLQCISKTTIVDNF